MTHQITITANLSDNDLLLLKTYQNDNRILSKFDFKNLRIDKIVTAENSHQLAIQGGVTSLAITDGRPMVKAVRRNYSLDRTRNPRLRGLKCLFMWNFQACASEQALRSKIDKTGFFKQYGVYRLFYRPNQKTCLIEFFNDKIVDDIIKNAEGQANPSRKNHWSGQIQYALNLHLGAPCHGSVRVRRFLQKNQQFNRKFLDPCLIVKVKSVFGIVGNNLQAGREEIFNYFSQICGEIESINSVKIRKKSNEDFYALVQFREWDGADKAITIEHHRIFGTNGRHNLVSCEKYYLEDSVDRSRSKNKHIHLGPNASITYSSESEAEDSDDDEDRSTRSNDEHQTFRNQNGQLVAGPNTKNKNLHNNVLKRKIEKSSFVQDPNSNRVFKKIKTEEQTIDYNDNQLKNMEIKINISQEEISPEDLAAVNGGKSDYNFTNQRPNSDIVMRFS